MPSIGDQMVNTVCNVLIGLYNCNSPRCFFHARGVESIIKPFWNLDGLFRWMIGQQQGKRYLRMQSLCCNYCLCGKFIKASVMADNEMDYSKFADVLLDGGR